MVQSKSSQSVGLEPLGNGHRRSDNHQQKSFRIKNNSTRIIEIADAEDVGDSQISNQKELGAITNKNESRNKSRLRTTGAIEGTTLDGKKHSHDIRFHSPLGQEDLSNLETRLGKIEETPTHQTN